MDNAGSSAEGAYTASHRTACCQATMSATMGALSALTAPRSPRERGPDRSQMLASRPHAPPCASLQAGVRIFPGDQLLSLSLRDAVSWAGGV